MPLTNATVEDRFCPPDQVGRVFHAAGLALRFAGPGHDAAGTLLSCSAGSTSLLSPSGALTAHVGDRPVAWAPARVLADVDELQVHTVSELGLEASLRHSFDDTGWGVRLLLVNSGPALLSLAEVTLTWRPAPGTVACGYAAGAEASYAVQPAGGDGPVLRGRLVSGTQLSVSGSGLGLGPRQWAPGERQVLQWRWEVTPGTVGGTRPGPRSTWLDAGQSATFDTTADVAVVSPGLAQIAVAGGVELQAPRPGCYPVQLRSARGTTTWSLRWAPDLPALVTEAAATAMGAGRARSGAVRLVGPAAGIVLQHAQDLAAVENPDDVADALDLLAGQVSEQTRSDPWIGPDPLSLAFLVRQADRTADRSLADGAWAVLLGTTEPAPGLGLAAASIVVSAIRAGRSTHALTERLQQLASRPGADPATSGQVELALLLRRRAAGPPDQQLLAGLRHLGATLGSGLPGDVVPPVAVDTLAYLGSVLSLLDDADEAVLASWWGFSGSELATRSTAQARARIAQPNPADDEATRLRALAWLVLRTAIS